MNSPSRFSHGASPGWDVKYWVTDAGSLPSWGRIEPGTEPSASRNSRMSAVRMEVSCRHAQRPQPAPVVGAPEAPPLPLSAGSAGPVPNGRVASPSRSAASDAGAALEVVECTSVTGSPPHP